MSSSTRALLLSHTEQLLQTRGYAAFSYADLADRVGIRKASIHHHFPTKEALGIALVDDYLERFGRRLAEIDRAGLDFARTLAKYAELFDDATRGKQLPLCGALAAGVHSLPPALQAKTKEFFDLHLQWLTRLMERGAQEGGLAEGYAPGDAALLVLSGLEGASIVAIAIDDQAVVQRAFSGFLALLCPPR